MSATAQSGPNGLAFLNGHIGWCCLRMQQYISGIFWKMHHDKILNLDVSFVITSADYVQLLGLASTKEHAETFLVSGRFCRAA